MLQVKHSTKSHAYSDYHSRVDRKLIELLHRAIHMPLTFRVRSAQIPRMSSIFHFRA